MPRLRTSTATENPDADHICGCRQDRVIQGKHLCRNCTHFELREFSDANPQATEVQLTDRAQALGLSPYWGSAMFRGQAMIQRSEKLKAIDAQIVALAAQDISVYTAVISKLTEHIFRTAQLDQANPERVRDMVEPLEEIAAALTLIDNLSLKVYR